MKKLNLIICFLFCCHAFTQNEIKVQYSGSIDTSQLEEKLKGGKYDSLSSDKISLIKNIIKNENAASFTLNINGYEGLFYQNKVMKVKKEINLSSVLGEKGIIYSNTKTNEILNQKEAFGELFLIESEINTIKWKLTSKSKYIDKYLCYKATTTKIIKNNDGIHEKEVEAWYCPELNFHFGPLGYCNLPGLILELKVNKYQYLATEIDLKPTNPKKINKPKKGKRVNQEEFEEIGLSMNKMFTQN